MDKKIILLIDPCSSRLNFIDEVIKAGCKPVCVFPYHEYNESFESMQYKSEVSTIKAMCREKSEIIEAPENLEDLMPQLEKMNVYGVINCSDPATLLSDVIAERLGCPLNHPKSSMARMDKFEMQKAIADAGLRSIESAVVRTEDEIRRFWMDHKIESAIVKPTKSGGMKGVHKCNSITESVAAVYSLLNDKNQIGDKNDKVVIQRYVEGIHCFFNTMSLNGTHKIMQAWLLTGGYDANGTYETMYLSTPLNPSGFREIMKYVYNVMDALDFRNGVAQTEVILDKYGPVLVELNPRMMKFYVEPAIQDKVYGNHNCDVAIDAMLKPEKFVSVWHPEVDVKPFVIKHLVSNVEGKRYAKPAETLFKLTKGVVKVELSVPIDEMFDMAKTVHRDLFPGKIQIFDSDIKRYENTLFSAQTIERRYPDLLWDTVIDHEGCGFTSDINEIESEIRGKTVAILNDINTLEWKDGKYSMADYSKQYAYGVLVLGGPYKLDERYTLIKKFSDIIKEGGTLYALQSSYQNMPYGESGMETILNLFGFVVEPPRSGHDTMIKCTVHH